MKKIPLSLAANYVSEWNTWCAIRELIQNAIDAGGYSVNMDYEHNSIIIESNGGCIPVSQLLLGNGTKSDDYGKIGKFGEGFKLALLILARQGYDVDISNGVDKWRASIEFSEMFKSEHLHITVKESVLDLEYKDRVIVKVDGLSSDEMRDIQSKYLPDGHCENRSFGTQLSYGFECYHDVSKLYVGGLYVCDLGNDDDKYIFSYNFEPSKLSLDRDRNAVSDWSLQHEVSMLLVRSGEIELIESMARDDAPDIRGYCEWNASYGGARSSGMSFSDEIAEVAHDGFIEQYGYNAYPISSGWAEEKKQAVSDVAYKKGLKPVIIPKSRYEMLNKEKIPKLDEINNAKNFDPIKHLEGLIAKNKKHMRSRAVKDFLEMVEYMKLMKGLR